ncbi:T-complex protein 11-domain-containing protein [Schizothecium vesticola]|uniref:T-complex protein 11-domain-containing protein n=1 Tax=Schizothecium vesticola TaxID=314040 RepID=A0AA40EJI8_9PEZI|nr:T-complex protein 11-domain-containing protein [Schizothecium vesticola]
MADQGGSGGIGSHMPTHRRQDSGAADEPIPAETTTETRNPETSPEKQAFSPPPPQDLPRGESSAGGPTLGRIAPVRFPSNSSNSGSDVGEQDGAASPSPAQPTAPLSRPPPKKPSFAAVIEPPVTKATLSELDVHKILHNPKLRHDINFDHDLHFRPNLDGDKGRKKTEKANQFWKMFQEQLILFVTDRDSFRRQHGNGDNWCLPTLLMAVKDIIQTLVPQRDRNMLNEGLDVKQLMQEFNHGVADLERLAQSLSSVLKQHCAPMRDDWVDEMYQQLSRGNRNDDTDELIKGMRSLLSVLEAMKLDVANHQIRCLRPMLIEDTVSFEQRFFCKRIHAGKLDTSRAAAWYMESQRLSTPNLHTREFGDMSVFFQAFTKMLLPSSTMDKFPSTFLFDEERIVKVRADLYDCIALEICMRKYEELSRVSETMWHINRRLSPLSSEGSARSSRSSGDFGVPTPASSRPSSFVHSDRGSMNSSPRNSGLFGYQPAVTAGPRAEKLYESFLDIVNTAPAASQTTKKWKELAPMLAVQIIRTVEEPYTGAFDDQLTEAVTNVHGAIFREVEAAVHKRLIDALAQSVGSLRNLSGVSLITAVSRLQGVMGSWSQARSRTARQKRNNPDLRADGGVADMALRLAHIGLLHFRVWGPILYSRLTIQAEEDEDVIMT